MLVVYFRASSSISRFSYSVQFVERSIGDGRMGEQAAQVGNLRDEAEGD